jgi:hypothetical protein
VGSETRLREILLYVFGLMLAIALAAAALVFLLRVF